MLFGASLFTTSTLNAQSFTPVVTADDLRDLGLVADTWLIGLDEADGLDDLAAALDDQGMELLRVWPDFRLAEVRTVSQAVTQTTSPQAAVAQAEVQRQQLESLPTVRYATPDRQVFAADRFFAPAAAPAVDLPHTALRPNDPLVGTQWALEKIRVFDGWNVTLGSTEMVVAVIDSGYELAHEDIAGTSRWVNQAEMDGVTWRDDDDNGFIDDFYGWDWVENDAVTNDPYGHGTHVGGTLAATTNNQLGIAGLGGNLKVMPLRVLDEQGSGQISDLVDALYYAMQADVRVANLSLVLRYDSPALRDAILVAADEGMLVIAATGNTNTGVYWPAAYPETLAIAATDDQDARAGFSNLGPAVDVAAPGVNILATYVDNSYEAHSGTSMATPHASALAALIWSLRPDLSADELVKLIRRTAVDVNADTAPGFDPDIGHGRIDFAAALLDASSALQLTPDQAGVRVSPPEEPLAIVLQVTVADDDAVIPIAGAVVHYALESVDPDDDPTGVIGRTVSDEEGLTTIAFLAPAVGGAYALRVQVGAVETTLPVSIVTEPNWILVTPATTVTTVDAEPVGLYVEVTDSDGRPVVNDLILELETDLGHWRDGGQIETVVIDNGFYEAAFFPGEEAGIATVRVREGYLTATVNIEVQPGAASTIETLPEDASTAVAAGANTTELTFFVYDRFGNFVADGTPVRLFASSGQLSASDLETEDGQVAVSLYAPADTPSPLQVWAIVPGTHAQTELTIVLMSNQIWLPVVASGSSVE